MVDADLISPVLGSRGGSAPPYTDAALRMNRAATVVVATGAFWIVTCALYALVDVKLASDLVHLSETELRDQRELVVSATVVPTRTAFGISTVGVKDVNDIGVLQSDFLTCVVSAALGGLAGALFILVGWRTWGVVSPIVAGAGSNLPPAPLDLRATSQLVWHGGVLLVVAVFSFFLSACMAMYGAFLLYTVLRGGGMRFACAPGSLPTELPDDAPVVVPHAVHVPHPHHSALPWASFGVHAQYIFSALASSSSSSSSLPPPPPGGCTKVGSMPSSSLLIAALAVSTLMVWVMAIVPTWAGGRFYRTALAMHKVTLAEFLPEMSPLNY